MDINQGKYPEWQTYLEIKKDYCHLDGDGSNQLMVYRKSSDDLTFNAWLAAIRKELEEKGQDSEVKIVSICGTCENSLLLLAGRGIENFINTEAAKKGTQQQRQTAVEGENDVVYFCSNLKLLLPKAKLITNPSKGYQPCKETIRTTGLPVIKVAVFDTGLLPGEIDSYLIAPVTDSCIPGAARGWNFTVPNDRWDDDNPSNHGTNVSRFIIQESLAENGNPVEIIPVKIHNREGKSDLYSVLCGFAYAKQLGAHIINASFGYYAPTSASEEYCVNLFRNYIKNQLKDNGILLIAAAGNEAERSEIENDFRGLYPIPADIKNLDMIGFYPASFSAEFPNVIAVTTVDDEATRVSDTQNFSPNVVDVGVQADQPGGFGFVNPRTTDSFIFGSSFATPILTGIIAANYSRFANPSDKTDIISTLLQRGKLAREGNLATKIKQGVVCKHNQV